MSEASTHRDGLPDLQAISHDLRTPLTSLAALLELLDAGFDGPLLPAQKERLRKMRLSVDRLAGLVDRIAVLARARAGTLPMTRGPVDLASAVREARRSAEPVFAERGATLEVDLPADLPRLHGDPARIREILADLLNGALRSAGSTVIQLSASHRGGMVELTLREGARGIPVEALPKEFPGVPAGQVAIATENRLRGIPFSAAGGLIQMHGGTLTAGRDAEGAVEIVFTLPADHAEPLARPERGLDAAGDAPFRAP